MNDLPGRVEVLEKRTDTLEQRASTIESRISMLDTTLKQVVRVVGEIQVEQHLANRKLDAIENKADQLLALLQPKATL